MKKFFVSTLIIALLLGGMAHAMELEEIFGGLTSVFSTDDEITYGVGEKAECEGISATLTDVMESSGDSTYGYAPADGNVYVICEFKIKNNTSEEASISSMMCFDACCDDKTYRISLEGLTAALFSGKPQLDCDIEPGKTMDGVVAYEMPEDWQKLKIKFTPDGWGGESVTFVVER